MKRSADNTSSSNGVDESNSPSKKCKMDTSSLELDFENMESLFEGIDFSLLDKEVLQPQEPILSSEATYSENVASSFNLDGLRNQRIAMKDIGNSFFLCAEVYKETVKIHIRKFVSNSEGNLIPTKSGVCLSLKTWYRFFQKVYNFNLTYTTASFVANNSLLVLNREGEMVLQDMKTLQLISLNSDHLFSLKQIIHDFNSELLNFLHEIYLPSLIASKLPPTTNCREESLTLDARIIACMEKELSYIFQTEFECLGCILDCGGQNRHVCMTTRELEKFQQLGDFSLFLVDYSRVAINFILETPAVTSDFLLNFNVKILCSVLFKTPKDM